MLTIALALLVSQAPPTPPKPLVFDTTVEGISQYHLPNGMKVVLVPDDSAQKVTVNLTVLVGSRNEGYGEKGMAHLLEHMLFKGTPTHKDAKAEMTARGARWNGTTREDRTNYFETLPASDSNTEFAIKFEADRLVNCFVAKKDLDTEMTVVRNEFEGSENNGPFVLMSRVRSAALPWHNYGRAVIGTRADIERVPIDNLKAFYQKFYQPDDALVVIAGKFDTAKVFKWVNESFGKIPKPKRVLPTTFTEEPVQDGERHVTVRRVGGNPVYAATWRVAAVTDPDYPALMVLQGALGDTPQGREHQALVDTKKASNAGCDLDDLKEPGLLTCYAMLKSGDPIDAVRPVLLDVAENLAKKPLTQAEVDRARTGWLSQMEEQLNSSDRVGLGLSEWAAGGDWRMMFVQRDRLKAVTAEDVMRVATKYLKPQNRTDGEYIPTERPDRAEIPLAPAVEPLVNGYKGGEAVAKGEAFDPSPKNIESRTTRAALSNGGKLILLPKKTRAQTVNVTIGLRYGNLDALKGLRVPGQMAIDLMARGTKKLPYKDFQSKLEQLKAQLQVQGGNQMAVVTLEVHRPELDQALDLVGDLLTEPAYDNGEFETLRKQMLTGLEQAKNEPRDIGQRTLMRALTPVSKDHPKYQATVPEQMADVTAAKLEQLKDFHDRFLGAQNAQIAVVGDFDADQVKQKLESRLGKWTAKVKFELAKDPYVAQTPGNDAIPTPDKAQAWIGAGQTLAMKDTDADYPALVLVNRALGGSAASRLFADLREKQGLSYGAYSALQVPPESMGERGVMFGLAIYAPQNLSKVETSLLSEFKSLTTDGLKQDELDTQKKAIAEERLQRRATDRELATQLAMLSDQGRTMTWEQQMDDKFHAVTLPEANDAAKKKLDPSKLVVVKAGDFKTVAAPK